MSTDTDTITTFITTLLTKAGADFERVSCEESGERTVFQIHTPQSKTLIGARGETIRAIDHIVKKAFEDRELQFIVDVNGYRMKKINDLTQTATMLAERARSLKYNVEMTPMSAYERMLVHSALADEKNIETESYGEGRDRRVVIRYVA